MLTIHPGASAREISAVIRTAPENAVVFFTPGEYYLDQAIEVLGKRGLTLAGDNAVLRPHFDRAALCGECAADAFHAAPTPDAEVMRLENCEGLILRGLTVNADAPANSECRVLRIGPDYVEVRVNSSLPFRGDELFISGLGITEEGVNLDQWWVNAPFDPARRTLIADEVPCTAPMRQPVRTEYLGDQAFRVYTAAIPSGLKPGARLTVQHTYYGLCAFTFRNCREVTVEDVRISNFGGFGFIILPRCENFIFRRLRLQTEDPVRQPNCLNSDGIHITGLTGRIRLEDCYFEFPGDDCLNLHGQVMLVTWAGEGRARIRYDKICGSISPDWARPGDRMRVWNQADLSMREVALAHIAPVRTQAGTILEAELTFAQPIALQAGDYISNGEYYPALELERCTVKNQRGRAFCIQSTDRLTIRDCTFLNVASPALYLSTAVEYWYEAGPVSNAVIEGCRFEAFTGKKAGRMDGAILARVNSRHPGVSHVHRNITIKNCSFEGRFAPRAIGLNAVDGVILKDNQFTEKDNRIEMNNCHGVEISAQDPVHILLSDENLQP